MNVFLKASCLAIYLLAVVGSFAALPWGAASVVQYAAVILLGAHALEVLIAFNRVKRYPGPLVDSIALTLLFGFLHWKPLHARANPALRHAA